MRDVYVGEWITSFASKKFISLTTELAKKAYINILSAQDTGRYIIGRKPEVYIGRRIARDSHLGL